MQALVKTFVSLGSVAAVAAAVSAAAQNASTVITACTSKTTGVARIVPSAANCSGAENVVTWNQTGPTGMTGATGMAGATGPTGSSGPQGPAGPSAFLSNLTIPSVGSDTEYVIGALSGAPTGQAFTSESAAGPVEMVLPDSCSQASLQAEMIHAPNGNITDPKLLSHPTFGIGKFVPAYVGKQLVTNLEPVISCTASVGSDSTASCTTGSFTPESGRSYVVFFSAPGIKSSYFLTSTYSGASVLGRLSCQ